MGYEKANNKSGQLLYLLFFIFLAIVFGTIIALFDGMMALLLFSPIVAILFIIREYRIGVILLIVILPFQHTPFLPSFTGFNIVNYLTAASLISMLLGKSRDFSYAQFPNIFWWAYLIPIGIAGLHGLLYLNEVPQTRLELIGIIYTSPKTYLGGMVIKPLFIVLIAWMLGTAAQNSKNPELYLCPLFFAALLASIAILSFVVINGFDLKFLASPRSRALLGALGMHANEFGFLLGTSFNLILFTYPAIKNNLGRLFSLICIISVGIALMLTFSRGGYVVAIIGVVRFVFMQKKIQYLVFILFIMLAIIAIAPEAIMERITTGSSDGASLAGGSEGPQDELTAGRVWLWMQLLPEFFRSPIWGSGVGSTAWSEMVKNGLSVNHPHNLYLRVLLDMGIVGFAFMFIFCRYLLRELSWVSNSPETPEIFAALTNGSRIALIGVLVAGWSNGNYVSGSELSVLWLAIGLSMPFMRKPSGITARGIVV